MATMIPADIQTFTTEGESAFYRFLKACAKPDERHLAWYLPEIEGREPDFILYGRDCGLIVFEVKDWALAQILAADPHQFTLLIEGKEERRPNPFRQARDYFGLIMDRIKRDCRLVSNDPQTPGRVRIAVNCGVVFPNINKYEYRQWGLHQVIPEERVFFWDDLHPQSPICADPTGRRFREVLEGMLAVRPRFSLSGRELNHLRQLIFPEVRIDLPERNTAGKRMDESRRLKLLDHHQESIARQFEGGHRIVAGPSGSGKTLVLVHRAALLKRYNPAVRNLLFVCYNITLVNYIRRLLADRRVPFGEGGVEVFHFFELCAKITGEEVPFEKADSEYYDMVVQETLERLPSCKLRYDAALIDEGQDFSDDMLRIVTSLLNPATNHLMIAIDDNQDIYQRRSSWKEAGLRGRGRVHRLSWIYRNTKEIAALAESLIQDGQELPADSAVPAQTELFPDVFEAVHGPPPELRSFHDPVEIAAWTASRVVSLMEEEGYPLSEIALIYAMKSPEGESGVHLPRLLEKALEAKGILHHWISEDYRAKKLYDVTTNSVTISTIHSVKGFDYACVFLLGLDWMEAGRWSETQRRKLAYVAVTRARERLFILFCRRNGLIAKLMEPK